jgi:hypothetical protein
MPLFHSRAAKARKAQALAAEAELASLVRLRAEERISALRASTGAGATRTIGAEQRCWKRTPAYYVASALLDTGDEITCRIVDVSFGGMRVEFLDEKARPGEFGLTVPTLRFVGIVQSAWTRGAQTGVEVLRWRESA